MATIKESALAYEPPQTKNIAELEYVSVDIDIAEETHQKNDGEEFTVKIAVIDNQKYRIPNSVLEGLKSILKKFPDTKYFCVDRSGAGMNTKYQVLPHQGKVSEVKVK